MIAHEIGEAVIAVAMGTAVLWLAFSYASFILKRFPKEPWWIWPSVWIVGLTTLLVGLELAYLMLK